MNSGSCLVGNVSGSRLGRGGGQDTVVWTCYPRLSEKGLDGPLRGVKDDLGNDEGAA